MELHIDNSALNPRYTPIHVTLMKEEILENHRSPMGSFEFSIRDEEAGHPSFYVM